MLHLARKSEFLLQTDAPLQPFTDGAVVHFATWRIAIPLLET